MTTPPCLAVENLAKSYDGVAALISASFKIHPGEVHALMGENGAGKSTLARIVAGVTGPDSGTIVLDGQRVSFAGPRDAQRCGVGIIHQELDLFPNLSVGENIVIGNLRFAEGSLASPRAIGAFCAPFLAQVGLEVSPATLVSELPIAQQQLVAIARAVSMDCRVLLMDEPSSALSDDATERLFAVITALKVQGVAIVYVSHKMDEIFRLCDRVTVLRDGRSIATLALAETNRAELIRLMVGRPVDLSARTMRNIGGDALLDATGLTTRKLRGVSFQLRRGEVLGIAGLVGAGRSELGAALAGLDRLERGTMLLRGAPYAPRSPADAQARGVALLPEDRKLQGLMLSMSVQENAGMATLATHSRAGFVDRACERAALAPIADRLALKCASPDIGVSTLSGGNQQKALLARWLLADPDLLFLDDPARGVDIGAKEDIYAIIDALAAAGKGVVLASSELPELLRCCDRILVLRDGALTATFDAGEASQEAIMAAATQEMAAA